MSPWAGGLVSAADAITVAEVVFDARPMCFSGRPLVGVGEVQAGGRDVVELLPRTGGGLRDVNDLQDLGTAEAG
jgi:hypothetical protein